jgi:L-iditol 2-dehydrogenase
MSTYIYIGYGHPHPHGRLYAPNIVGEPGVYKKPCPARIWNNPKKNRQMSQIKASVLKQAHELTVETRDLAAPGPDEVQVAVKSTTLCGSDMHYYHKGANGDFKVREPLSLGHESAGEVVAIGENVSNLSAGDKVALEVGIPCGQCELCRKGRYNLCSTLKFRSSAKVFPHFQGTLQEKINCPASWCHKLPENLSVESGALVEPLSVAIHATNRAQVVPGSTVLVLGAGAVGLFAAAMARICGATRIVIADIAQNRVDFAVKNGIATDSYVVPMKRASSVDEKLSNAREIADDLNKLAGQYDYTFECTGVESCVQTGIFATKPGGKLLFVGMGNPIQTLHIGSAALREVDLIGVFRYANCYPTGISLMAQGMIPALDKFITHRVNGLDNVEQAFELAGKPEDKDGNLVIKVVINN